MVTLRKKHFQKNHVTLIMLDILSLYYFIYTNTVNITLKQTSAQNEYVGFYESVKLFINLFIHILLNTCFVIAYFVHALSLVIVYFTIHGIFHNDQKRGEIRES